MEHIMKKIFCVCFVLLDDYKDSHSLAVNIAVESARKWIDDYNYVKAYDILEPLTGDSEAGQLMDELMALVNERGWLRGNDGPFDYNDGHW